MLPAKKDNPTLERIRKLIALSASSNENEARNAALQACKLILEHKVQLYLLLERPMKAATVEEVFKKTRHMRPEPFPFVAVTKPKPHKPYRHVRLTSKYMGTCRVCGGNYYPDDEIFWMPGEGDGTHEMCGFEVFYK